MLIQANKSKKQQSLYQLISTIPRDKPPRMPVKSQILTSRESSTSQLLPLSLSVQTRPTVKSSQSTISVVVPSISHSLKSQEVSSKSRPLMVIHHWEEKISISLYKVSSSKSSKSNTTWISPRINSHSKESEKPLKRQRLNCHQLLKPKLTCLISQLMPLAPSICKYQSPEPSSNHWSTVQYQEPPSHQKLA